ncbi:MAG: hypothetical protein JWP13_564 [Candidatus Saccharibacteria bacterium]|nr:hypothetical protein [Candidatus Saccharibacteria bacterium]
MTYEGINDREMEMQPRFKVERLNEGLNYGDGGITGSPEGATAEELAAVDSTIEQSPQLLVPVDTDENGVELDDDGCGDGRGVAAIFRMNALLKRSLNRAKVFGGAAAMAVGSRIGLGRSTGRNLNETFEDAAGDLAKAEIDFGAHTDEHAHGENCGCGAIDKAPQVVANVVKFKEQIRTTALSLGASEEGLDQVLANYESYADEIVDKPYSGNKVMQMISGLGKVVKRLAGDHKEARIVLNTVEGFTVNQELIRQVSGGKIQVFAVDVWRMQRIAQRLHPQDESLQQRSFVSQLVYTLGVAGTLTDGTLPAYLVSEASVPAAVEA